MIILCNTFVNSDCLCRRYRTHCPILISNITPANEKQKIKYRSFKNLDVMALNEDLSKVNIQVQSNTSTNDIDVNEIYEILYQI
jgi:hypothetical protein